MTAARVRRVSTREREVAGIRWTTPYYDGMGADHWTRKSWDAQIGGIKLHLEWRGVDGWCLFALGDRFLWGVPVGRRFAIAALHTKWWATEDERAPELHSDESS